MGMRIRTPRNARGALSAAAAILGVLATNLAAESITWQDSGMEFAVLRALEREEGPVYVAEFAALERLNANADRFPSTVPNIASLEDLRHAESLEFLDISGHGIGDETIASLGDKTSLRWLYVSGNHLEDIGWVSNLSNLLWFAAIDNQISSLEPFADLPQLQRLFLGRNQIEEVYPLAEVLDLTHLYLERNRLADISPLAQLGQLRVLSVNFNRIRSFNAFEGHEALRELYFALNHLRAVEDTADIPGLQWLDVRFNFLDMGENTAAREWFEDISERVPVVAAADQGSIWIKAEWTTAEGDWVYSDWMGHLYRGRFPQDGWSWVLGIGWVWCERFAVPDGVWFYSAADQDWYFTGDLIAPMAYRLSDGEWVQWVPAY